MSFSWSILDAKILLLGNVLVVYLPSLVKAVT
jgi:hypothetical protein